MTKDGLTLEGEAVCRGIKDHRGFYSISMETCGEMYQFRRRKRLPRKKTGIDINRCIRRLKKRR